MKNRFAVSAASAATALVLLGACSDDGPTTLAKGEVGFVGGAPGLSEQTMDITAEEEGDEVTGQARFSPAGLTVELQCADTETDGLVIVGGAAAADGDDGTTPGEWVAVVIREGDPDGVVLWFEAEDDYGSCQELLDAVPAGHRELDSPEFADVTDGDIET